MNNKLLLCVVLAVAVGALCFAEPAFAGPGGKIARAVFESFWGKVLLLILTIVFAPLIIMMVIKEKLAERRSLADLRYMAKLAPEFEWLMLRQRISDCFHRVHAAWRKEDVSEAAQWMSTWYWQNQQLTALDQWERDGLRNVCNVKSLNEIRPLHFALRNAGGSYEGSMLVVGINANMQDYLEMRDGGKLVEGSKTYKDVDTVWTFTLTEGRWVVSNIEEDAVAMMYANLRKHLAPIEELAGQRVNL